VSLQVHAAEGVIKGLQGQLQESAAALAATTADYKAQVGAGTSNKLTGTVCVCVCLDAP
jgi:hypothetical protein